MVAFWRQRKDLRCETIISVGFLLEPYCVIKFQTYKTEIPQEDGTDVEETVDEAKNFLKVSQSVSQSKYQKSHKSN